MCFPAFLPNVRYSIRLGLVDIGIRDRSFIENMSQFCIVRAVREKDAFLERGGGCYSSYFDRTHGYLSLAS